MNAIPETVSRAEQAALLRRIRQTRNAMRRAGKPLVLRKVPRVIECAPREAQHMTSEEISR